jgi:acetyl-CoA acetyltransferase
MRDAFLCDYVRTPIGRFAGALAKVRADDLGAVPIRELIKRYLAIAVDVNEVYLG